MASGYSISATGRGRGFRNNNNNNNNNNNPMGLQYQKVEKESFTADIQKPYGVTQEPWGFYRASTGGSVGPLNSQFMFENDDELEEERRESFYNARGRKNVMDTLSSTCGYMDADNLSISTCDDAAEQIFPSCDIHYKFSNSVTAKHHRQGAAVAKTSTACMKNKKPYASSLRDSPVVKLEELSKCNKLSSPSYTLTSTKQTVKGFVAVCTLSDYLETGYGNSETEAREDAAIKMLKTLHIQDDSASDDSTSENDYGFEHSFSKNKYQKGFQNTTRNECKVPLFQEINSNLGGLQQKSGSGPHYPLPEFYMRPTGNKQYVWLIQSVASKMNFNVRYEVLPHCTSNNLAQCLVHLCKNPPIVCYGSAKSENKAKSSAARCAFEYLKTIHQE